MYTYIIYDVNIKFSLTTNFPVSYHSMLDSEPLSVEVTFQVIPFSLVVKQRSPSHDNSTLDVLVPFIICLK